MSRVRVRGAWLWLFVAGLGMLAAAACGESTTPQDAIHVLKANGDVNQVMEAYIRRGISEAEQTHAKLVVIELDTPGGDLTSMRTIVQDIEQSTVPTAVYVYPPGARAASAGTFITMSANIAAMAPSTNIGAASPINANGTDIGGTLGKKVMNDAVAFIRSIATLRGRNADWAAQAVQNAVAVNSAQAVQLHVVDFQANDFKDLLRQSEGRTVSLPSGAKVTLTNLESAPVVQTNKSAWEDFLNFLSDPTTATLLIGLGFVALIIELVHPGFIAPGVLGAIAIILGFVGLGELPVNNAGLVLIGIGLVCLAMELFFTSGVLGAMGVLAIVVGGIIAFHGAPAGAHPSTIVVVILIVFAAAMVGALAVTVMRVRNRAAPMGTAALVGKTAVARTVLAPDGYVFVQGERWRASMEQGTAQIGERVRIVGADGFRLRVQKENQQ